MNKLILVIVLTIVSFTANAKCYLCSHRSSSERYAFIKMNPKPCCGRMIVDHIHALKHGGMDNRYNMQWQSYRDAKVKDRWE